MNLLNYYNPISTLKDHIKVENETINKKLNITPELILVILKNFNNNNNTIDTINDKTENFNNNEELDNTNIFNDIEFFFNNDNSNNKKDINNLYISNPDLGYNNTIYNLLSNKLSISSKYYLKNNIFNKFINNIEELKKRQQFIKFKFNDNIKTLLNEFKENELSYYWFLDKNNSQKFEITDFLLFKKLFILNIDFINNNSNFMNYYYTLLMILSPLWGILSPFLFFSVPFLVSKYYFKLPLTFSAYLKNMLNQFMNNGVLQFISMAITFAIVYVSKKGKDNLFKSIKLLILKAIKLVSDSKLTKYIYLVFALSGYLWSVYTSYLVSKNYYNSIKYLFRRVKNIYNLINYCNILLNDLSTAILPESIKNLYDNIKTFINNNKTVSLLLNNNDIKTYFSNKFNLSSDKGKILKLFHNILKNIDILELNNMVKFISYIEIYYNLQQKINELNFCETNFLSKSKPQVTILNLYHPIIKNCKQNSINFFYDPIIKDSETEHLTEGRQNLILTGPNGSGKSTFLKTITLTILLSQTIGYAPAEYMSLTPFHYISTYLNIPDCVGKESLFQAEMDKCFKHLKILEDLENNNNNNFSFNIMDEIFVSTNYYEGMSGATAIIKELPKFKKSINIITTHFDECIKEPNDAYIYKHFTVPNVKPNLKIQKSNENNNDNNYLLIDGINKKHCAISLMEKHGFNNDIINNARITYNKCINKKNIS